MQIIRPECDEGVEAEQHGRCSRNRLVRPLTLGLDAEVAADFGEVTSRLLRPGKSQPWGSITPRRRPSRHHCLSSSNSWGDSIAFRSLRPSPCSTRISMRVLSISPILRATTSETRTLHSPLLSAPPREPLARSALHRRRSRAQPCVSVLAPPRVAARLLRRSTRSEACELGGPGRAAATGPAGPASR